jgi:Uma2 family endonuclease
MKTLLPRSRPLNRADFDALRDATPNDGRRYELIDGVLVVTPGPTLQHQRVLGELLVALHKACPRSVEVLFGPLDVTLSDDTVMQPDLLVAPRTDFTERDLPTAPLLAVEVLTPSTRLIDLLLKHSRFEEAGAGSYWVIDPIEPTLTAWDLVDGRYVQVADVRGDEPYEARRPFPVTVVPAQLRD